MIVGFTVNSKRKNCVFAKSRPHLIYLGSRIREIRAGLYILFESTKWRFSRFDPEIATNSTSRETPVITSNDALVVTIEFATLQIPGIHILMQIGVDYDLILTHSRTNSVQFCKNELSDAFVFVKMSQVMREPSDRSVP